MSLIAPVTPDGKLDISETSQETEQERKASSSLDKEDFLLLLVTQMKYQDPLEPADNTEFVAQLAQFSELEQMQNLNQVTTNTSAYTLVGKEVYIEQTSGTGSVTKVQGRVEYVTLQNGKAYVSVDGELYSYDDIVQVIDQAYLISQYLPSVKKQNLFFMHHDAQNLEIKGVNLGSNGYQATSLAVVLMAQDGSTLTIPSDALTYKDGTLTIKKDALASVYAGEYTLAFVFNDANETVDYESVTLTVMGNRTATEPEFTVPGQGSNTPGNSGDNSNNEENTTT